MAEKRRFLSKQVLNLLCALEFQGRETQMHSMLTLILSGVTEYDNLFPSFTLL